MLLVLAAVAFVGADLFLMQRRSQQALRSGFEYAGNIELSDVRVVRGVPGCPERCAAGTLVNRGEQPVAKVHLSLQFQDAGGRPLGSIITPVEWTPAGELPPGGSAAFLYSPISGLIGINPRLSSVAGRVVTAEVADPSMSHGIVRTTAGWILRHSMPARPRTEWHTPQETMEYAKQVTVTVQVESSVNDRYRVKGEVRNDGGLPLREVIVALSVVDSRGVPVAGQIVQPVRYYYNSQEGPYEPLAPGSVREFAAELSADISRGGPARPPVSLQATLGSIILEPKRTAR